MRLDNGARQFSFLDKRSQQLDALTAVETGHALYCISLTF